MKKIEIPTIIAKMSVEEAEHINDLIDKDTEMNGKQTEERGYNLCPCCSEKFERGDNYCRRCGQRVIYVDSDVIPFEDMRAE